MSDWPEADATGIARLGPASQTFGVSLNETGSAFYPAAPLYSTLGTLNPVAGRIVEFDPVNFTGDGHPIHIHQTRFQVVGRTGPDGVTRPP